MSGVEENTLLPGQRFLHLGRPGFLDRHRLTLHGQLRRGGERLRLEAGLGVADAQNEGFELDVRIRSAQPGVAWNNCIQQAVFLQIAQR